MKKLLLTLISFITVSEATSQIIFSENWDGIGPGLSGWTLNNVDGLTPNASISFVNAAWVNFQESFDNKSVMSTSYYTPAGTSNDWLISPTITVPTGTTTLYWDAKSFDVTYKESYKVFVSTTGNAVANMTNLAFTQGDGTTGASGENSTWTRRSVDLTSYAGQTINIGFQNFSNDMFLMSVDNIQVINNNTCKAPDRTLTATTTNNSATLNWSAVAGATSYDLAIGTPGFSPNAATHTSSTNSYMFSGLTPNTRYQVYVRNTCGSMWIGPLSVFTATTIPYSYGFENPATNSGYFADGWTGSFSLNNSAGAAYYADGAQMVFSNSSMTAATNRWLYSRPIYLTANEVVTLKFSTRSTSTTINNTLIAKVGNEPTTAAQSTTLSTVTVVGTAFVENTATYTAPSNGVYYFSFNHNNPITSANTSLILDKIVFTSVLSAKDFDKNTFSLYPNPANDFITISNKDNSNATYSIVDINGRAVANGIITSEFNQINVQEFTNGVYFINFETENGKSTQKFIKN